MIQTENSIKLFSTISPEELKEKLILIGVIDKFINNHWVKYFYIIDKIYSHDVINKNEKVCRMHSDLLRRLLGSYYPKILKNLINCEIIQLTSKYSSGIKSNGYQLVGNKKALSYEFYNSHQFVRKLLKEEKPNINKDSKTLSRLYRALTKIEHKHLNIKELVDNEAKFIYYLESCQFQVVGGRGKRVYNNFTNLPKSLRSKVLLNGEKLVFVDIVNSQMVFLAAVIRKTLNFQNVTTEGSTDQFITLSLNGKLYEHLMDLCGINDRKLIKDNIFQIIFGKKSFSPKINKIFSESFPQVLETIKFLKKDDYKVLSHQMQQMEANVVFKALDSIDYEKNILTIHDSLYSAQSDLNTILEALVNSFQSESLSAVINVNNEYIVNTMGISNHSEEISRIIQSNSASNITEPQPTINSIDNELKNQIVGEKQLLKISSIDRINELLKYFGFLERIQSKSESSIIDKLAEVKAKYEINLERELELKVESDDPFDDLPF